VGRVGSTCLYSAGEADVEIERWTGVGGSWRDGNAPTVSLQLPEHHRGIALTSRLGRRVPCGAPNDSRAALGRSWPGSLAEAYMYRLVVCMYSTYRTCVSAIDCLPEELPLHPRLH